MGQEKSEALVLRGVDFSESSRIVTFLTPERGRMACLAKGARRTKRGLGAVLDTFNRVELVYYWKDGRQVQTLAEASLLNAYSGIKRDFERGAYAAFPLELAYRVAHENEPSEALYDSMLLGLGGLAAWPGAARTHVCWQVLRLLSAAGFEPSLEYCVVCGAAVGGAPGFLYEGGVACGRERPDVWLSPGALALLRRLAGSERGCPAARDEPVSAEVFMVLRRYAAHQLETDFRSLRVLDELFPGATGAAGSGSAAPQRAARDTDETP